MPFPERPDVWVLGNLTIDDLVFSDGATAMGLCGGNAIFAALGARLWAARVGLSARVGPDYPSAYLHALEATGIELRLSAVNAPSIHNWALYEDADTRRFVPWVRSGTHLQQSLLSDEVPDEARAARVCHIAPMPLSVQANLVRHLARASDGLIALDPHDEYIADQASLLQDLLPQLTLFLPSRREAALLYGHDAPDDAARAFARAGPRVVAIKLGAEGSLACAKDSDVVHHIPAIAVAAIDPTGAGDAFCGAFAAVFGQGGDVLEAARRATVAASFVVQHYGATTVVPFDRDEAERRYRSLLAVPERRCVRACAWTS
jgi:sugar/nucleoside kinase (ribokinase family)